MAPSSPVRSSPRRRFTLLDGMALVGASAVGCSGFEILKIMDLPAREGLAGLARDLVAERDFGGLTSLLILLSLPVATAWTLTLVALRLIGPRPPWRRLARQPGLVAGLAALAGLAAGAAILAVCALSFSARDLSTDKDFLMMMVPIAVGLVVLGAWLALALGGRWRAEPVWIDRLGRALGIYWIAVAVASPAVLLYVAR